MRGRRRRGRRSLARALAAPVAVLVLLLAAAAARATTDTVIGFDDLISGTVVTDQYRAEEARLGTATALGSPATGNGDCGSPTVATGAVPAHSGSNYATLAACALPGAGPPQYYAGTFVALVGYPRGSVGVQVRSLAGSGAPVAMSITGYDSGGAAVATGSADAVPGGWTSLVASQPGGAVPAQISWVLIATSTAAGAAPQIAIDDLEFDQAGAPLTATGAAVTAVAGTPFQGTVATLADGDPTATASDFSATIDWGDDSSSAATIAAAPGGGSFTVIGTHTWSSAGSYPVRVAVSKVNGRTASASSTASVTGAGGGGPGGGGGGAPSASLALTTPNPVAGQAVGLTGAGSQSGPGRTIISYGWDFNDDGHVDTSTGTNPTARFQFTPGVHTVALTVTDSGGGQSTSRLAISVGAPSANQLVPDGGQGPCEPTYDDGDVHIVAECIQTLPGGGHVIQTRLLDLNGMTLAPKAGGEGVFKVLPFNHLGIGNGTQLSGPVVNVELLNTPVGDLVLGGADLTAAPWQLTFHAFVPPKVLRFARDGGIPGAPASAGDASPGPDASAAGAGDSKTLLVSLGAGHSCSAGSKDPSCCPKSGPTTACATLPGDFPITGQVNVYLNGKGQVLFDVQVGLDLQAVDFQATGALEIVADLQSGINLNSLQFTIPQAGLASIFEVKDASFTYYWPSDPDASKRDTWQAKATFIFGPLSQPSLAAELDFQKGQFHYASMTFTAPSGTGVPIYPGILLNQIGGSVGVNPLQFGGQLGASIAETLELSLAFKYADATDTQLGFFGGQGTLSLSGDKIATLAADVYSDGYTDAALDIDLHFPFDSSDPVVSVTGHIGFWDEPSSGRWEADGSVGLKLWIISAEVAGLVNDQYVAGCADISGFGAQGRYRLSDGNIDGGLFAFSNCADQLKQYKETPVTQHTGGFVGSIAAAGGTIAVPGGGVGQELDIATAPGTPVVQLTGPGGVHIRTPSAPGMVSSAAGSWIAAIAPDGRHVLVLLRHPHPGRWLIEPAPGAPAVTGVRIAADVGPAVVHAHARRLHARAWSLGYTVRNYVAGTRIQFVERGRDSAHVIGTVARSHGTLRFVPADALGRARTIYAYLRTASGAPLRTVVAGRYRAPAAARPGRIRFARIVRRPGSTALVSWGAAPGARRYRVTIHGSDGRVTTAFTAPARRSLRLAEVLSSERFSARIVALGGPNMLSGPAITARLAPDAGRRVELLACRRGRCTGSIVSGALVLGGAEVRATLSRAHAVYAAGIAADPSGRRLSVAPVAPRRTLGRGRYLLTLSWGHGHRRTTTIQIG